MRVTFKPCVRLHRQRKDKTFCVFIRIGYNSKYNYIETEYSASKSDIKGSAIKTGMLNDKCNAIISQYREITDQLSESDYSDVSQIIEYIKHKQAHKEGIDFLQYLKDYVTKLNDKGSPSREIFNATYNHFVGYIKKDCLPIKEVTSKFLTEFEKYLVDAKVGTHGINSYIGKIRVVYNNCMDEYEDLGYTFNYPFRKYKLPTAKLEPTVALTKEQLLAIINIKLPKGTRAEMVRDLFIVSLFTLGTNATDLYDLKHTKKDRLEYCRNKTKNKRSDNAFISIKIEPELKPYIKSLKGSDGYVFNLRENYKNNKNLNGAIRRGLREVVLTINKKYKEDLSAKLESEGKSDKVIAKALETDFIHNFDFYDARRTMASIMRNKIGISKDDVASCLNHVDLTHKTTDFYIEVDFSILDRCNRKFLDYLFC